MKTSINRRQFLKLTGTSLLSMLLQQCGIRPTRNESNGGTSSVPESRNPTPTMSSLATTVPSQTATANPTATPNYQATTAIGQIHTYEVSQLRQKLQDMFQLLGGLADVIRPGARVTIKPNLTGGTWSDSTLPAPTTELFVTHPALVRALAELLIDAAPGKSALRKGLAMKQSFSPGATQMWHRVSMQV